MAIKNSLTGGTNYTQAVFRVLLDCMARPGKISGIKPVSHDFNFYFNPYILGVAITLLDQEVTFCINNDQNNSALNLTIYTLSSHVSLSDCDYFLVDGKESFDMQRLKKGQFKYPDQSATIICQVEQLLSAEQIERTKAVKLQLTGPGILNTHYLYITGLNQKILPSWQDCNREFPLGLDWIFVDQSGRLSCVPRSTKFAWAESSLREVV